MIANSLKTYSETVTRVSANPLSPRFWPKVPQWENFRIVIDEAKMGAYFINSTIISSVTVTGIFIISTFSAYAFSKMRFAGKDIIFSIMLATLMIPETVLLIPNFLTVSAFGWIDRLPALTIPFMGSAFFIFMLRQFFNQIPNAVIESAVIDGCSHSRILWSIAVPLTKAPIFTVGFLAFHGAWNALQWPLVVTQTDKWRPIAVGLTRFVTEAGPESQLRLAGAVIAILPILIIYMIAQRQITEAIARTGMKG
jgi:ABC-type glycerol-3-phosphate transport system permease component